MDILRIDKDITDLVDQGNDKRSVPANAANNANAANQNATIDIDLDTRFVPILKNPLLAYTHTIR